MITTKPETSFAYACANMNVITPPAEVPTRKYWSTCDAFRAATQAGVGGQREVVFDLSELAFIDSTGIRAILEFAIAAPDKAVVLQSPRPSVRKVIQLTGVEGRAGIRIEA